MVRFASRTHQHQPELRCLSPSGTLATREMCSIVSLKKTEFICTELIMLYSNKYSSRSWPRAFRSLTSSYVRKHLDANSAELVEVFPRASLAQSLEKGAHERVRGVITTVENNTLNAQAFTQVVNSMLPVSARSAGAPPSFKCMAPVRVMAMSSPNSLIESTVLDPSA
eukprot:SAG11_NODE_7352_length_1158_cov_1.052930_2_plen_168_part_00